MVASIEEPRRAQIRIGRGPLATERLLLADLDRHFDPAGHSANAPLPHPALLVVPSKSLRIHLLSAVARHRGRAVLGLTCHTLRGLAVDIVARTDGRIDVHDDLIGLYTRRHAHRAGALREALEVLHDGYGQAVGPVRDLLDAGLDPAHLEAFEEVLGEAEATRAEHARARDLLRVAAATRLDLERGGVAWSAGLLQTATERAHWKPELFPEKVELFVYGFADATGSATDLLTALLGTLGGTIYLDRPVDPADRQPITDNLVFGRRFAERLADSCRGDGRVAEPTPPEIFRLVAADTDGEARTVATSLQRLLASGAGPEGIGIVCRDPAPFVGPLRRHLARLAIPFSGIGLAAPTTPDARRAQALLDLLRFGVRTPVERWLELQAAATGDAAAYDLVLAFAALGAGRLDLVPYLDIDPYVTDAVVQLPAHLGFAPDEEADDQADNEASGEASFNENGPMDFDLPAPGRAPRRSRRRTVPAEELRRLIRQGRAVVQRLEARDGRLPLESHRRLLAGLLLKDLAWAADDPLYRSVDEAIRRLPTELRLDGREMTLLLEEALNRFGAGPLGGAGGGVQVLDVTEARSLTFDHLYLIGLNRGSFPRTVKEDPLFPDRLREALAAEGHGVLPDLPRKLVGHDEERYLFAQLLGASPKVTLSWHRADEDHRPVPRSPLVERLSWSDAVEIVDLDDPLREPESEVFSQPVPAFEKAIAAGLEHGRQGLAKILVPTLDESRRYVPLLHPDLHSDLYWESRTGIDPCLPAATDEAAARLAILAEIDAPPEPAQPPGPYLGMIGPIGGDRDPRSTESLWVTTLERLAACPWQAFLERVIRLEPTPDPLDLLPELDPRLVGSLIHRVLERIAQGSLAAAAEGGPTDLPHELADLRMRPGAPLEWPPREELIGLARHEAAVLLRREGVRFEGLEALLADLALERIRIAQELESNDGELAVAGIQVVAAEVEGSIDVSLAAGAPMELRFRADRADRVDKSLRLTDFKTGKGSPVGDAKKESTARTRMLKAVAAGRLLQGPAYARALETTDAEGRYLYLHPELNVEAPFRQLAIRADDEAVSQAFERAVGVLVDAWRHGILIPRLVEPGKDHEPRMCDYCAVKEACLRGDSGARQRLDRWARSQAEAAREAALDPTSDLAGLLRLWFLPTGQDPLDPAGEPR